MWEGMDDTFCCLFVTDGRDFPTNQYVLITPLPFSVEGGGGKRL
jgi:hypothetical protein